jgi:hypothetical protein
VLDAAHLWKLVRERGLHGADGEILPDAGNVKCYGQAARDGRSTAGGRDLDGRDGGQRELEQMLWEWMRVDASKRAGSALTKRIRPAPRPGPLRPELAFSLTTTSCSGPWRTSLLGSIRPRLAWGYH